MSGVLYALGILLTLVIGLGLGLRRSPSPKRRLALVEEAVRRRYKGRVELRSAAFLSVFKDEGIMAVVAADRGEAIEALADRLVRQVESAEAEAKKRGKEAEGPSCARWEDGTRTEIWRVFSWCSGDEHADRMCWILDGYLRGVGRDPSELRRGAPGMGQDSHAALPPCFRCRKNNWLPIPDSLAMACTACGAVLVETAAGGWEPGASLQEWAADLATASQVSAPSSSLTSVMHDAHTHPRRHDPISLGEEGPWPEDEKR